MIIKNEKELNILREGGKILANIMRKLEKEVKSGITTEYLNRLAESLIFQCGGNPSFKGHNGYPATLCVSVNEEIVHAVPSDKVLKIGDIISLDLGIEYKGFFTDTAITLPVGKISRQAEKLIAVTKEAFKKGIAAAKQENYIGDIGFAIQNYVESQGFSVIRELVGHGVGKKVHESPEVPNYGKPGKGLKLEKGMVLAIEPMVAAGDWKIRGSKDGFGFETIDGSLSAHFEHTVAVTEENAEILTYI